MPILNQQSTRYFVHTGTYLVEVAAHLLTNEFKAMFDETHILMPDDCFLQIFLRLNNSLILNDNDCMYHFNHVLEAMNLPVSDKHDFNPDNCLYCKSEEKEQVRSEYKCDNPHANVLFRYRSVTLYLSIISLNEFVKEIGENIFTNDVITYNTATITINDKTLAVKEHCRKKLLHLCYSNVTKRIFV